MFVGNRMSKNPVTATPQESLSQAQKKMQAGGFRRVPVVSDGKIVGIITERDMRAHIGYLDQTRINGVMTEKLLTVRRSTTLEEAAQMMLRHKIGGLPVVEEGQLVGIITTSDILKAFLDVIGAAEETSTRIDFMPGGNAGGLTEACGIVSQEGGEVLGIGTYRGQWGDERVCYLRIRSAAAGRIADLLRQKGFNVLGTYTGSPE